MKHVTIRVVLYVFFLCIPHFTIAHTEHHDAEKTQISEDKSLEIITLDENPDREEAPQAHSQEGHVHNHGAAGHDTGYEKFIKWIGNFHPIANHFPIALIIMTGFSEFFAKRSSLPIFDHSSRFMMIAAAVTATPAALFGLAYGYEASYTGTLIDVFWWHRFFGISTAILAVITVLLKELYIRKKIEKKGYYYTSLIVTLLFVTTAGYLGGEMTFGLNHLFP